MMPKRQKTNAEVSPKGSLETLSQREVQQLREAYPLFRKCALAILNTGAQSDNAKTILEAYADFEVRIHQQDRGIRLSLHNAPADAFVDGQMIASTRILFIRKASGITVKWIYKARRVLPIMSFTCCAMPKPCARAWNLN